MKMKLRAFLELAMKMPRFFEPRLYIFTPPRQYVAGPSEQVIPEGEGGY